jgi:hypothetical protein
MSNPDNSVDGLYAAFPSAIFVFIIVISLFQVMSSHASFKWVLWIGIPLFGYLAAVGMNVASQYTACGGITFGKAALGGVPSLLAAWIGLGIASFETCRIPIATVFAPLFVGKTVDVTRNESNMAINSVRNSKACCTPKLMLEDIEANVPMVKGLGYGFYLLFAMLFGGLVGTGIAVVC